MAQTPARTPFPSDTAWSTVLGARDRASPEWRTRLDQLIQLYWRPVCGYLKRRWGLADDDAADLTQELFLKCCDERFMSGACPENGRFRTFLKVKLRGLVIDELRRSSALKRGGGARIVPLHPDGDEPKWTGMSPEDAFDRDWAWCVLHESLRELETTCAAQGRSEVFKAFWHCAVMEPPTSYHECAKLLKLKETDVSNYVFRARALLREIVRRHVRESVLTEADVEPELTSILQLFELCS
ncbi:MAG: sigma-70 family RNA polymerase sigma factor [Planctomycetes bacterium]|nr:sigma-70 family RNA polymerase sigma factor [Planctomycetota bacterium]